MLWLWTQPSCDQDKGQHTDLPQQHGSCISNHSHRAKMLQLYPRPDAFDHVHCFFSSIALKIGLRIPTYIISFIWDGFPYISYLLKQSGKNKQDYSSASMSEGLRSCRLPGGGPPCWVCASRIQNYRPQKSHLLVHKLNKNNVISQLCS